MYPSDDFPPYLTIPIAGHILVALLPDEIVTSIAASVGRSLTV